MNMAAMLRQTAFLSASHFIVRAAGFAMRIWLSRELGAQAMGLVELAQSAQMLLITPVVSGLPAAMSRMCACRDKAGQVRVLRCGLALASVTGLLLMLAAFLFRTPLALWLGDMRTLPALIVYLPCIPILGASCALNGYFYGTGRPVPPALGELLEQLVRFLLCLRLVHALRGWPVMLRSAIPAAATLVGETVSLAFMLLLALGALFAAASGSRRAALREMLSLALPLTGMKLVHSLMRTVSPTLIPARLRVSGLPATEALARLGMLNGMLMPMLFLPSFVTGSLSMVAAPEAARRQARGAPLRRLVTRVLLAALFVGLCAMAAVYVLAPFIAERLYRQAELLPMLQIACPLVPVMALSQVVGGLMNGLGMQGTSLRIALAANLATVLLTYALTAMPALRLTGAIVAMAAGHVMTLAFSLRALLRAVSP